MDRPGVACEMDVRHMIEENSIGNEEICANCKWKASHHDEYECPVSTWSE